MSFYSVTKFSILSPLNVCLKQCTITILLFEKINERNCFNFCIKNEIKSVTTFEMLTVTFEMLKC